RSVIDDYMTFLGYQASRDASIASTTVLTNGTAIGKNARVGISNAIVLGGTGVDTVNVGIGTTTPHWTLQIASSTAPQLTLTAGITDSHWSFRNMGGTLVIGTSSPTTFATSTSPQIQIASTGFGTTTLSGLTITGSATSTSNVGFNLTSGCFAINDTCIGGGGGASNWTDGGIYLTPLTATDGILINAATSTITNLTLVNATSTNATTTGSFVLSGGRVTFSVIATTTIPNNSPFAWTIATTTGVASSTLFRIDTTSGSERVTVGSGYSSDVIIGSLGGTSNLIFEESATIHGQGTNTLTFGTTGDKINFAVNTGFGSSTPWKTLSVNGSVAIANLSVTEGTFHTLCIDPTTFNVIQDNDDACTSSSLRYKHDVQPLNIDSLDIINSLKPSAYVYNDKSFKNEIYWGFIAEDMALTDLQFGTNLTDINSDGLPQDYYQRAVLAVTVDALQELDYKLESLATSTSSTQATSTSTFATRFFSNFYTNIVKWLAEAGNGIGDIFANTFRAKEKICVDDQCLTKDDIRSLLDLSRRGVATPTLINTSVPPPLLPPPSTLPLIATSTTPNIIATTTETITPSPIPEATTTPATPVATTTEPEIIPTPLDDSQSESSAIADGSPDDMSRGEQSTEQTIIAEPVAVTDEAPTLPVEDEVESALEPAQEP
ncbi:MAG TPA: tail fiber domain-containing protein, partial [Candidatus Paceibacterota bacterium]